MGGKVAEPGREVLDGIKAGVATKEFGDDLVVHGVIRDGDKFDLDAGQGFKWRNLFLGGFTVGSTDGEAHGLAGVFLADGFPIGGADPVLRGIPKFIVVAQLVLVAVFLLDHLADADVLQHVGRVGHGGKAPIDVEHVDTSRRRQCSTRRSRGFQQSSGA